MIPMRGECPECGAVKLKPDQLTIRICLDSLTKLKYNYCFVCPKCKGKVAKPTTRHKANLLRDLGVNVQFWQLPAELAETHSGAPITADDILDFHLLMDEDDMSWFGQLAYQVQQKFPK